MKIKAGLVIIFFLSFSQFLCGQSLDVPYSDSTRQRKIDFEYPPKDSIKYIEATIGPLWTASTDDIKSGFGGTFILDYTRFSPAIIRGDLQLTWHKFKDSLFENARFVALLVELDILFRPDFEFVRPFAGAGLSFYYNSYPSEEYCGEFTLGPYDESHTCNYEYGSGFTGNLVAGSIFRITDRLGIALQGKYIFARPGFEYTLYEFPDEESKVKDSYSMRNFTVMFGLNIKAL